MTELKPCPFCGGEIEIVITDDEGNIRGLLGDTDYVNDPWSGLAYAASHSREDYPTCPVANWGWRSDELFGGHLYNSVSALMDAFNTRVGDNDAAQA
jgi:hypothetical protein